MQRSQTLSNSCLQPVTCLQQPCSSDRRNALLHMLRTLAAPDAMEACTAMKPLCLPISLTSPMPQRALLASTCTRSSTHWRTCEVQQQSEHGDGDSDHKPGPAPQRHCRLQAQTTKIGHQSAGSCAGGMW
jgi:hypothetical protein